MSTDILSEFLANNWRNRFLLASIIDRFVKLYMIVSLTSVSADTLSKAFVDHWVLVCGPSKWLLSDNGSQFTSRFFRHGCETLNLSKLFTTTYNPNCSGQIERFIRTIVEALPITSPTTRVIGTYTRILSRTCKIRKFYVRPNVLHLILRCLAHRSR